MASLLPKISKWYLVAVALLWIVGSVYVFIEQPDMRSFKGALLVPVFTLLQIMLFAGALYLVVVLPMWFVCSRIYLVFKKRQAL